MTESKKNLRRFLTFIVRCLPCEMKQLLQDLFLVDLFRILLDRVEEINFQVTILCSFFAFHLDVEYYWSKHFFSTKYNITNGAHDMRNSYYVYIYHFIKEKKNTSNLFQSKQTRRRFQNFHI